MIDVRDYDDVLDAVNAILNNGKEVCIKNERRKGEDNIVVVEIIRTLKTKRPNC